MNYIAFMADGTKKLLNDEGLLSLDAQNTKSVEDGEGPIYLGSRNADLPRFSVDRDEPSQDVFTYHVVDTVDGSRVDIDPDTNQPWADRVTAAAYAETKNQTEPTVAQVMTEGVTQ